MGTSAANSSPPVTEFEESNAVAPSPGREPDRVDRRPFAPLHEMKSAMPWWSGSASRCRRGHRADHAQATSPPPASSRSWASDPSPGRTTGQPLARSSSTPVHRLVAPAISRRLIRQIGARSGRPVEVAAVLRWLRQFNEGRSDKVQFFGVEYYLTGQVAVRRARCLRRRPVAPELLGELRGSGTCTAIRPDDRAEHLRVHRAWKLLQR